VTEAGVHERLAQGLTQQHIGGESQTLHLLITSLTLSR